MRHTEREREREIPLIVEDAGGSKPQTESKALTEMPGRNTHPRLDTCLLSFSILWVCGEAAVSVKEGTEIAKVCCSMSPSATPPKLCSSCSGGKCCVDNSCTECQLLSNCPEGMERRCTGTVDYKYFCIRCPDGTFSDTENGCCIPWTDCEKQGLKTLRPGNHTHNVQCSQEAITTGGLQPKKESLPLTILTVVTTMGLVLLILMTFVLIIGVWTQKEEMLSLEEGCKLIALLHLDLVTSETQVRLSRKQKATDSVSSTSARRR
uniref:TNFR-Cys domain-containing protein n=1 Tax=Salvator merianae TaxID=96440 RepID=A0A8D0BQY9_SALMN